jgi:Tfp pilus assembly protein PilN
VVELLPDRIDVVLYVGGRRARARRLSVALPSEARAWLRELERAAEPLATAVEELGAAGARTTVLYRSPTQAVDLSSLPVKGAEALQAAWLECLEALPYPATIAVSRSVIAGRDESRQGPRHHVVTAADREDICQGIAGFIDQADLRFVSATPINAATMARLVPAVTRRKQRGALLYVGDHNAYFLVAEEGRLIFQRQIRLGTETIVTSLTRPIRGLGESGPVHLDATAARRILHERGLPDREDVVDEALSLTGVHIIPLMQPVLQQFIVELRQSLRFGLSAQQRRELEVRLTGPGSSISGLAGLIANELEVEVTVDEAYERYRWSEPGSRGSELADAQASRRLLGRLGLQPPQFVRQAYARRLKHSMWGGAAAAVLGLAVEAVWCHVRVADARTQADAMATDSTGQEQLRATVTRLTAVTGAMTDLENRIVREVGSRPSYRAILQELSRLTPQSIRITSITLNRSQDRTVGSISGFAFAEPEVAGRTRLEAYIEELRQSPLLREVALGGVQIGLIGGRSGQRFDARFVGVPLPPPAAIAAETGEGQERP